MLLKRSHSSTSFHRAKAKSPALPSNAVPMSESEAGQRRIKVDRNGLVRCRVCRCTSQDACSPPCSWVDVDLCSSCKVAIKVMTKWAEGAHSASLSALVKEYQRERDRIFTPVPKGKVSGVGTGQPRVSGKAPGAGEGAGR